MVLTQRWVFILRVRRKCIQLKDCLFQTQFEHFGETTIWEHTMRRNKYYGSQKIRIFTLRWFPNLGVCLTTFLITSLDTLEYHNCLNMNTIGK
jgi:hypothetical protein